MASKMENVSRFLEPKKWAEQHKDSPTRLENALAARAVAIANLDPLVNERGKLAHKIDRLLAEYMNPSTPKHREREIERSLNGRDGLQTARLQLISDIRAAQMHVDDADCRVRSAQKEIDELTSDYVNCRTVEAEECLLRKMKAERTANQTRERAEEEAQHKRDMAAQVEAERKDEWGAKLKDSEVAARAASLRRTSKTVMEQKEREAREIEAGAKEAEKQHETRLANTKLRLVRVGREAAVKAADKTVNHQLASGG